MTGVHEGPPAAIDRRRQSAGSLSSTSGHLDRRLASRVPFPSRYPAQLSLPGNPQAREDLLSLGKEVYTRRCAGCHGTKGDGKGPSAAFLNPKPRDFTTGLFKFRSTAGKDSLPTDADLYMTLTHGLWGTSMPSMQEIPDRQRWAVVQYIKTFSDRWEKEPAGHVLSIPAEVPPTPASIENGKAAFQANCALCHGDGGKADGPLAGPGMLMDDWGEPVKPAHLSLPAGAPGGVKLGHDGRTSVSDDRDRHRRNADAAVRQHASRRSWDLVHYVQSLRAEAHEAELVAAGLKEQDREHASEKIWASMSNPYEVRATSGDRNVQACG